MIIKLNGSFGVEKSLNYRINQKQIMIILKGELHD